MNDRLKKQLYTYKRRLEDKKVYTSIYVLILFTTIILYGGFGIYPLIRTTRAKIETIEKLNELNEKLQLKVDDMLAMRVTLERVRFYISSLESVVPMDPLLENYLVDFSTAIGSQGFNQKSFYSQGSKDGVAQIRIRMSGPPGRILPLMRSIESLERLTKINSFSYNFSEDTAQVDLMLEIYYLPE